MKIYIVLFNALRCELAREVINPDPNDEQAIGTKVRELLSGDWQLEVGDTIQIEEA